MSVTPSFSVTRFRAQYRKTRLPKSYSGALHGVWIPCVTLLTLIISIGQLQAVTWAELGAVPVMLFIASNAEYFFHRYILHRRVRGLSFIYRMHTLEHHHYFTDDHMAYKATRDFHMVFFPYYAPLAIFALLALLGHTVIAPLLSPNLAWLFVACGMTHYFMYEVIHFCAHVEKRSFIGHLRMVRFLRLHHTLHHRLSKMSRKNFNITAPLCDLLYGTYQRKS